MTTRDPDLLLDLFLEEGPAVLPDRVLEAVREDVNRQRQRTRIGPWRFLTMRTYLAAAAVVAVVAIGGGLLLASRGQTPGATSTPVPTVAPTPIKAIGALQAGDTYTVTWASAPFIFEVPASAPAIQADGAGSSTTRLRPTSGGAITIHDGAALPNNLCHPTGVITKAPNDVEAYLRKSSPDMSVTATQQLGSVRYWDVTLGSKCYSGDTPPGSPDIWFSAGERHRVFAIPVVTPRSQLTRTLIAFTWGNGYGGEGDEVLQQLNPMANALVQSIQPYGK